MDDLTLDINKKQIDIIKLNETYFYTAETVAKMNKTREVILPQISRIKIQNAENEIT